METIREKLKVKPGGDGVFHDVTGNEIITSNIKEARTLAVEGVLETLKPINFRSSEKIRCPHCHRKHPRNSKELHNHIVIVIERLSQKKNNQNREIPNISKSHISHIIEEHNVMINLCEGVESY